MSNIKEKPKQVYFYYRYCETTKNETFIVRETPITDNLYEMYGGYPNEIEFPLGTIFSIISKLIEYIVVPISVADTLNYMTECLDELSNDIEDVKSALQLFILMAQLNKDYCNAGENENTAIYNLNMFITECLQNTEYLKNDYLEKIILTHNIPFPKSDRIVVDYSYPKEQRDYAGNAMKNFLDNSLPEQNMWSKLFEDTPIHKYDYYAVNTMSGLITTLLKVIFDNRKPINMCEHCYNYFVPLKRSDEKYCITNKYFGKQDCKVEVRNEQQRKRFAMKQSEVGRMERSVKNMLNFRCFHALPKNQIPATEYGKYLKQIKKYKLGVAKGKYTEEEYKEFLKTFYKRKYK